MLGCVSSDCRRIDGVGFVRPRIIFESLGMRQELGSALAQVLKDAGFAYVVQDEVLLVTVPIRAGTHREPRRKANNSADDANRWHQWTAANGVHTVEAKFISANSDTVCLEKRDGSRIKVAKEKLSEKDLGWIRHQGWKQALSND